MPPSLKSLSGAVLSRVPLSALLGSDFRRQLRALAEADAWPLTRTRGYQEQQLRELFRWAVERTPYYRAVFEQAGVNPNAASLDDVQRLPFLTRDMVRQRRDELCAVPPGSRDTEYVSTGGTSGEPLAFYIHANRSPVEYAYLVAGWQRAGFRLTMPMAVLRGRVVPARTDGMHYEHDPLLHHHYFSTFHLTPENIDRYIDRISQIGSCVIHAYPSAISTVARHLAHSGRKPPGNVRAILVESEIVYAHQRELVERVFGCRYFSSYGMTEKVVAAAECEHSSAYHVWPTYGFTELVDQDDNPVTKPGTRGEIVATGFVNRVMPFIRYRTGDFATYLGTGCDRCGRAHMLLGDIQGHRIQESLIASDGAAIAWTALNMHDDTFENVIRFQFHQTEPGAAMLRILPSAHFGVPDTNRIQRNLGRKFDGRLAITIELVHDIPLSRSGKTIYVDQRIPNVGHQ